MKKASLTLIWRKPTINNGLQNKIQKEEIQNQPIRNETLKK